MVSPSYFKLEGIICFQLCFEDFFPFFFPSLSEIHIQIPYMKQYEKLQEAILGGNVVLNYHVTSWKMLDSRTYNEVPWSPDTQRQQIKCGCLID